MSYPVQDKVTRRYKREGFQRIVGLSSAWAAHKVRKCVSGCFYCEMYQKLNRRDS